MDFDVCLNIFLKNSTDYNFLVFQHFWEVNQKLGLFVEGRMDKTYLLLNYRWNHLLEYWNLSTVVRGNEPRLSQSSYFTS